MTRITILYAVSLVTVLVLADASLLPAFAQDLHEIPGFDKVIHFALFGILALLVNLSLARRWPLAGAIVTGGMIVAVLATAEELSNLLVTAREYSLGDLAANYLGVLCLGVLPFWTRQRKPAAPLPREEGWGEGDVPKGNAPSPRHGESPAATYPLPKLEGFVP